MTNEYGLDTDYFKKKLRTLVRDVYRYKPAEMYRSLIRLASVAHGQDDGELVGEKENLHQQWIDVKDGLPPIGVRVAAHMEGLLYWEKAWRIEDGTWVTTFNKVKVVRWTYIPD